MIATRNSSTRNLIEMIANELEQADKVLIGAGPACPPLTVSNTVVPGSRNTSGTSSLPTA